jgi:hypothetical protein
MNFAKAAREAAAHGETGKANTKQQRAEAGIEPATDSKIEKRMRRSPRL